MKVVNGVPPEITPEQRESLLSAVRAGRLPWAPSLMKRAGITHEEAFPDGKQPIIQNQKMHDVELGHVTEPNDPEDRYTVMVIRLAMMHGYSEKEITEKITNSETFKEKLKEVRKKITDGKEVIIGMEDLDFLKEEEE